MSSPFGDVLFANLEPWQTPELDAYCQAIGVMFDPIAALVADTGVDGDTDYTPGYGTIFDIDNCPTADLPYLGQFVGVQLPTSVDDATARALIRAEAGINRGTVASIISAVQRNLTGTQSVILRERTDGNGNPDAYQIMVSLKTSEVASLAAIQQAVNQVKPAGVVVNYIVADGNIWADATQTWAADTFTWAAAFNATPY